MGKECSLSPLVSFWGKDTPLEWEHEFKRNAPLEVEIGFGDGEVLLQRALENPGTNFLGIEQKARRVKKALRRMDVGEGVSNIRIVRLDARMVFKKLFSPRSINSVYCLFPCPWPKKKHVKYRVFSKEFISLLNNRLQDCGSIKIVTDYYPYYEWVVAQAEQTGFEIETKKIGPVFGTKYERKWEQGGQREFFEVNLKKVRHLDLLEKEKCSMKTYIIESFSPENFFPKEEREKGKVVFKTINYDSKRLRCLVQAIVVEEDLTQYVWIEIVKIKKGWRVCCAEGQNFFPTSGIVRALHLVYQTATQSSQECFQE